MEVIGEPKENREIKGFDDFAEDMFGDMWDDGQNPPEQEEW